MQTTPNNSLSNPIIIKQETSGFPVSVILNETNYTLWSQLMEMRIGARNKVGYLTGAVAKPALNDPNYDIWITENHCHDPNPRIHDRHIGKVPLQGSIPMRTQTYTQTYPNLIRVQRSINNKINFII
jgi:hypothetical protein